MEHPLPDALPLYVDLDGTLVRTDTLHESVMLLLRRHPLNLLRLFAWLLLGKAGFKQRLADAVRPEPAQLPYDERVLGFLRSEHARGRTLVLASAADARIVRAVADHLGLFADVLGTEAGGANLSRANKREAIAAHARERGHERWAYAGNSHDDLPVWQGASEAVAANASASVLAGLHRTHPQARVFEREALTLGTVLRAIRLKQWAKNALLFVPLLAAHSLDPQAWVTTAWAFVAFGLCASATYLLNDLLDLPNDRVHRTKRHRPLAAGRMGIAFAVALGALMVAAAFALALWVSLPFAVVLLVYTVLTLAYSLSLKRFALIDVLLLSGLYTLRLVAGAAAADVTLSNWLLALSLFLFLSLALVKRCAELEELQLSDATRTPGRGYHQEDLPALRAMGVSCGFMAVLVLSLYIDSQNGRELYREPEWLWAVVPLLLLWLMRIWLKVSRRELHGEDPVEFALRDRPSWLALVAVVALAALATWAPVRTTLIGT